MEKTLRRASQLTGIHTPVGGHPWEWTQERNVGLYGLVRHGPEPVPLDTPLPKKPEAREPTDDLDPIRARELRALYRSPRSNVFDDTDPVILEAVLAHSGGYLAGDDICDVLKWSEDRYNQALQDVANRLERTGLQLTCTGWDCYAIASRLHLTTSPSGGHDGSNAPSRAELASLRPRPNSSTGSPSAQKLAPYISTQHNAAPDVASSSRDSSSKRPRDR